MGGCSIKSPYLKLYNGNSMVPIVKCHSNNMPMCLSHPHKNILHKIVDTRRAERELSEFETI